MACISIMSAIHVSTQWKSSTVFAGEEIECTITFENVSQAHNFPRIPSPSSQLLRGGPSRERWKETLQIRSTQGLASSNQRTSPSISGIPQTTSKTHKPSLSLSTSHRCPPVSMPSRSESVSKISSSANNKHRRSVSIVSIGGETIDEAPSRSPVLGSGRPIRGHLRAASLQVLPRRMINSNSGPQSGIRVLLQKFMHS